MSYWPISIDFQSGVACLCFGGLFGCSISRSKKINEINEMKLLLKEINEAKKLESKTLEELIIDKCVVDTDIVEKKFK